MLKSFLFLIMVFSCLLLAQSGSLIMVRCDNDEEFLESPSQMQLGHLQSSFDTSVDTVVFVHGYMTNFDDARGNFEGAVSVLKSKIGKRNYVGFHWPSKVLWFGTAVTGANTSGRFLLHVLSNISKWYGSSNKRIHLMTHSLGARVLLNALKLNEARYVKWGYCFNMAAAVHNNAYIDSFAGTNEIAQKNYVYYSDRDGVLKYIYTLYYWLFDRNERGREFPDWDQMSDPEKIEYLQKLDQTLQEGGYPQTDLDMYLMETMERASKEAMGLVGSVGVSKVENLNVSDIASSHSYWEHTEVLKKIAEKMQ